MKNKKKFITIGIVAILFITVTTTAFASSGSIKVTDQKAEKTAITQTIEVEGNIETENEITYYAQVTAPIAYFDVQAGDFVQKGEKVLSYDAEEYERSVEKAKLQASALQSSYQGALNQNKEYTDAYTDASTQDQQFKQEYESVLTNVNDLKSNIEIVGDAIDDQSRKIQTEMAQLRAEIAQKNAIATNPDMEVKDKQDVAQQAAWLQVELAKKEKQLTQLQKTGAKPAEDRYFDEAEMYLSEIATQRSLLQQEMLSTKHAAMNYAQLKQIAENVALAEKVVAYGEEDIDKAKTDLVADLSGVISEVSIEEGAMVTKGTKLFSLKDKDHVKAVVDVTSHEMGMVAIGQKATVTVSGNTYEGTVSKIRMETVSDAQNKAKLQVEIHMEAVDDKVYLGTDVDATIYTGESDASVTIPKSALYADDQGDYCYVNEQGIITKKYVTCGLTNDTTVEILDGLTEDNYVITSALTDNEVGKKCK